MLVLINPKEPDLAKTRDIGTTLDQKSLDLIDKAYAAARAAGKVVASPRAELVKAIEGVPMADRAKSIMMLAMASPIKIV
jgi:hypothetical protein